jgi:uncharacterized protein DUF7019
MVTDNFPQSYIYISRRLVRELYQQHRANRQAPNITLTAKLPGINVQASPGEQPENDYWLARKATDIVRDNTGSLLDPGTYIRATMDVTWADLPFLEGGYEVAWLTCVADTDEGPVFAALCGSIGNYVGYSPGESQSRGWYPSRATGMERLLKSFSADNDDVDAAAEWGGGDNPEMVISSAFTIAATLGRGHIAGHARLEVLFQVFRYLDYRQNTGLRNGQLRAAMIGTPIWAVTVPPLPATFETQAPPVPEGSVKTSLERGEHETPAPVGDVKATDLSGKRRWWRRYR